MSCGVQCSSQSSLLSKLGGGEQNLIQYIKHLAKHICTEIPVGSFFLHSRLLSENNLCWFKRCTVCSCMPPCTLMPELWNVMFLYLFVSFACQRTMMEGWQHNYLVPSHHSTKQGWGLGKNTLSTWWPWKTKAGACLLLQPLSHVRLSLIILRLCIRQTFIPSNLQCIQVICLVFCVPWESHPWPWHC